MDHLPGCRSDTVGYVHELWVIGIDGSDDHLLYTVCRGHARQFREQGPYPRPDYFRYHIVKADGSSTPAAFEQTPYGDIGVVWSPDGNWFYFTAGINTIYRASTDPLNESFSVVTTFEADGPARWSLSPQGDRIALTTNGGSPVTAVVNVDGMSSSRQITTPVSGSAPAGCYSPVWSPTGADVIMHCYFFPNIKIYKASSTAASPVTETLIGGGQSNKREAVYAGLRPTR